MVPTSKNRHCRKHHGYPPAKKRRNKFNKHHQNEPPEGSPDGHTPPTTLEIETPTSCDRLDPSSGFPGGEYYVKIIGTGFPADPDVLFGEHRLKPEIASCTSIMVQCPPGEPGSVVNVYPCKPSAAAYKV
jgi:hypothetical protein